MKKIALITGITGQDGSFLSEILLDKGYMVHGIIRRSSSINTKRIDHLIDNITLHYGDMTDSSRISELISMIKPDEIYNLAAQSHVRVSFDIPHYTSQVDAIGTLNILEAVKVHAPKAKFYQASTSELFGKVQEVPQKETTPFYPRSPYGVAKLFGYWMIKNYREAYGMFACNGILFNHESERRGKTFLTRKVVTELLRIKFGEIESMSIGNLEAKRDWGYAKEYCEAMWLMLQQDEPEDFVIATGKTYSVRDFIEKVAIKLGFNLHWEGEGVDEIGIDKNTGKIIIKINPRYFRPTEVELLIGDPSLAKEKLGWEAKVDLDEMIDIMIKSDLKYYEKYKDFE